jgi:ERCC4-type nuclease
MKIIIDVRENALYEQCLATLNNHSAIKIDFSLETLNLGDIIIRNDTDPEDILIIERKTFADLFASIKDGRYEEQSYRLTHSSNIPITQICYLIEGMFSLLKPHEKKLAHSAMTSIQFFKGFRMVRTATLKETAEWLIYMTDKIGRDMEKGKTMYTPMLVQTNMNPDNNETSTEPNNIINSVLIKEQTSEDYCKVVKKVKKENITKDNIGEIILTQIPGISSQAALAIMKLFASFSEFTKAVNETPDIFYTITMENTDKNGNIKKRKINKSAIQTMLEMLGK